jgi:glutamine transport system substrate-binding protein
MDEKNQSSSPATPTPETGSTSAVSSGDSTQPIIDSSLITDSSTPSPSEQTQTDATVATPSNPPPSDTITPLSSPTSPSSAPQSRSGGSRFPWIFLLVVLFIGFLALATWYFRSQLQKTIAPASMSTQSATRVSQKTIIVGTDPTFQPMEFMQKGEMVGYDIDLANLLGKQQGVQVTFKNITFDNLFSALQQRQIDMIISAVTITPERLQKYAFSEQYLNAGQVIITQKVNTVIKSPKDLKGKKIGVQQGTTDETEALKYTNNNLVIRFPDFVQATKALVSGNIDAIITDLPSAQGIVGTNPTLKIASDPFTNDYYGIVFRKGDPQIDAVNKSLDSLRVRGYLTELKHKWLD